MSAPARPWALVAAAALAFCQSWLWFRGTFVIPSIVLLVVAATLLVSAFRPKSRVATLVSRVWAPPRRPGESPRAYRIRIAIFWLIAAGIAYLLLRLVPAQEQSADGELREMYFSFPLLLMLFLSLIMALQALLTAVFGRHDTPN
jgi:hypothetical protein